MIWIRSANSHTGPRQSRPHQRPDRCQHPTTRYPFRKFLLRSRGRPQMQQGRRGTVIAHPASGSLCSTQVNLTMRARHKGRLPVGRTDLCPVKARLAVAAITEGPLFRRIWRLPSPRRAKGVRSKPAPARYRAGYADSIALIVQRWIGRAGFDGAAFAGHSLRRGAISSGSPQESASPASNNSPATLRSRALEEYVELEELRQNHPLKDVL